MFQFVYFVYSGFSEDNKKAPFKKTSSWGRLNIKKSLWFIKFSNQTFSLQLRNLLLS